MQEEYYKLLEFSNMVILLNYELGIDPWDIKL